MSTSDSGAWAIPSPQSPFADPQSIAGLVNSLKPVPLLMQNSAALARPGPSARSRPGGRPRRANAGPTKLRTVLPGRPRRSARSAQSPGRPLRGGEYGGEIWQRTRSACCPPISRPTSASIRVSIAACRSSYGRRLLRGAGSRASLGPRLGGLPDDRVASNGGSRASPAARVESRRAPCAIGSCAQSLRGEATGPST